MKILVIDDTRDNLRTAKQTLAQKHEVLFCHSYDDALEFFSLGYDENEREKLREKYEAEGIDRWEARERAKKETFWDVVLCDLLMPAGRDAQGKEGLKLVGQEMPVGWSLALLAVKYGAKFVAVVTNMNHHNHPASAMLDRLNAHIFTIDGAIDGARVMLTNHVEMIGVKGTSGTCEMCEGTGKRNGDDCYSCDGSGVIFSRKGKDWERILNKLMGSLTNP